MKSISGEVSKSLLSSIVFFLVCGMVAADDHWCQFKAEYFAEFDLTPLNKQDGHYSTENIAFVRLFEFNFCQYMVGTEMYARMTDLESGEVLAEFGAEPTKDAYLEAYGAHISGNRGMGEVRGAMLTYKSEQICGDKNQFYTFK